MVNISFSLPAEKFKQVYELNMAESETANGKEIPISQTISLLVQRGLAYTLLLQEKAAETSAPKKVAVKGKHRNKEW